MNHDHAVVIGGSVAGLTAAAALSNSFDRVTVVERDELPATPEPRAGAAQGNQVHVVLPLGLDRLDEVLPAVRDDFVSRGCREFDQLATVPMMADTGWKIRVRSADAVAFRRPLLELIIRERVFALGNVAIERASVRGVLLAADRSRVTGIRLRDGSQIEADLVVDCSGRRTKLPDWLKAEGFETPVEVRVNAYMGYATQFVRVPQDALDGILGLVVHPTPEHTRGGVLLPADNGVHSLSAIGMMRDYPPRDRDGFLDFLDDARSPLLGEIARKCEPVSDIHAYHQEGNLRRRWEQTSLPERLLVLGDAVASFNPVYGQGMTMAASGAALLREELATVPTLDGLATRVQNRVAEVVDDAFAMAAAVDASFEGVEFTNYAAPSAAEQAYSAAIDELTTVDPDVALAAGRAAFYIAPGLLHTEDLTQKVQQWQAGPRALPGLDPDRFPTTVEATTASDAA